jgi:hypothetical protein
MRNVRKKTSGSMTLFSCGGGGGGGWEEGLFDVPGSVLFNIRERFFFDVPGD